MNAPKLQDFMQIKILTLIRAEPALSLTFQQLKTQTRLTDGNLVSKLRSMEMNGYLTVSRGFIGKKRYTRFNITPIGQMRIHEYITAFNYLVNQVKEPEKTLVPSE